MRLRSAGRPSDRPGPGGVTRRTRAKRVEPARSVQTRRALPIAYRTSAATARAARYRPSPYTAWVTRLFTLLNTGVGVREEAIPAPMAGCRTRSGATEVARPMKSAGSRDGARAHFRPNVDN